MLLDVARVVQESGIEVVPVDDVLFGGDVNRAAGEGVGGICAHCEVLTGGDERWVCEEGVHNTTEHDGTGGGVLEFAVPVLLEFWAELGDFGVGWTKFGADI